MGAIAGRGGAGGADWFYLYKPILPIDLCFVCPRWFVDPSSPVSWIPLPALVAMFVGLIVRRAGVSIDEDAARLHEDSQQGDDGALDSQGGTKDQISRA